DHRVANRIAAVIGHRSSVNLSRTRTSRRGSPGLPPEGGSHGARTPHPAPRTPHLALQPLLEAADLHRLLEPQRQVRRGADGVVEERVGRELGAALGAAPVLGGGDQGAADAVAARGGLDEPAFQVRDAIGDAVLGIRADVEFREPEGTVLVVDGEQDGQRFAQAAGEELLDLARMVARLVGPQCVAHAEPGREILRPRRTHRHGTGRYNVFAAYRRFSTADGCVASAWSIKSGGSRRRSYWHIPCAGTPSKNRFRNDSYSTTCADPGASRSSQDMSPHVRRPVKPSSIASSTASFNSCSMRSLSNRPSFRCASSWVASISAPRITVSATSMPARRSAPRRRSIASRDSAT